jgi:hypothetical protein
MSDISIIEDSTGMGRDVITIKNAKIKTEFNNFTGNHGYNGNQDPNNRNFSVIIDDESFVAFLESKGWNVKTSRDGERYLQIHVSYRYYNPESQNPVPSVIMRNPNTNNIVHLDESTVGMLDDFRRQDGFEHCDLIFKGSPYQTNNAAGVSGYLQWMQVTPRFNEIDNIINELAYTYAEEENL